MRSHSPPSRILIIDDTPVNLAALAKGLGSEYAVTTCQSPIQALALLEHERFDLILLDIVMPGLDGFTVFRRLHDIPLARETPVIFVTALNDPGCEVAGLELGAIDFIFKPLQLNLVKLRVRNILQLAEMSRNLRLSQERLQFVLDASNEGVWDWDVVGGEVTHNLTWCRMLGLADEFLRHPVNRYRALIHPEDRESVEQAIRASLEGNASYAVEYRLRRADDAYIWVFDRGRVIERDHVGQALRMAGIVHNIQDRKEHEEEIYRLAFFDPLTELPNRRLLLDRLAQAMIRARRSQDFGVVLFVDLDGFKAVNDTHGHAVGDMVLIETARRLRQCLRSEDTVARLGGDEFVLLLQGLAGPLAAAIEAAGRVADKVLKALNQPYQLDGSEFFCTPSLGLTLFDATSETMDEVLRRADVAMYAAKAQGKNRMAHRYRDEMAASDGGALS